MATTPRTDPLDTYLTDAKANVNAWFDLPNYESRENLFDAAVTRMIAAEAKLEQARTLAADLLALVTAQPTVPIPA